MGTRADFYVGRDNDAEWLGSIAWDGYPEGIDRPVLEATHPDAYREKVANFLERDDATLPDEGWPWPWETSATTDFAYAFDGGVVYASCFGSRWTRAAEGPPEDYDEAEGDLPDFPDMSARKNVQMGGKKSGLIVVSAPLPPDAA